MSNKRPVVVYDGLLGVLGEDDTIPAASVESTLVGRNLLNLPNPSAVRFLRINADNSISARTAGEIRSDIGANNAGNLTAGTLPAARFNDTSHGSRAGGNLHALATGSAHGFMSSTDKAKIDGLAAVASSGAYSDLSGTPTLGTAAESDASDFATAAQGALADSAVQPAGIANFETTAQLNARDTANRNRANHTGSQAISTVSGLQAALDSKQASITGGATTITGSNLTASRVLVSDGSGKVAVSSVTAATLGYLDATSSIQSQLDSAIRKEIAFDGPSSQYVTHVNRWIGDTSNTENSPKFVLLAPINTEFKVSGSILGSRTSSSLNVALAMNVVCGRGNGANTDFLTMTTQGIADAEGSAYYPTFVTCVYGGTTYYAIRVDGVNFRRPDFFVFNGISRNATLLAVQGSAVSGVTGYTKASAQPTRIVGAYLMPENHIAFPSTGIGINFPQGSQVAKTSGNWITGGADAASSSGSNLTLHSWNGIGFACTVSGQSVPQGENAVWLSTRTGDLSARGRVLVGDGSSGAPSISFLNAPGVGIRLGVSNIMAFEHSGLIQFSVGDGGTVTYGSHFVPIGEVATAGLRVMGGGGTPPSSSSTTGNAGMIRYDSNYIYVCVGASSWKRAALSTF